MDMIVSDESTTDRPTIGRAGERALRLRLTQGGWVEMGGAAAQFFD